MLAESAAAESLREVSINELAIPRLATPHAMRVVVTREKIALDTSAARVRRTVGTRHLRAEEQRVVLEANAASVRHLYCMRKIPRRRVSIFIAASTLQRHASRIRSYRQRCSWV